MTAIFELQLQSETLTEDEISDISGCVRRNDQVNWLKNNGWVFILNHAKVPKVGRLYARLKLAGINPTALVAPEATGWRMDVTNVR